MCKVYNTIGALKAVKSHLDQNGISDFKSLNEVITFQKNYSNVREQITADHETLIKSEINTLSVDISDLEYNIQSQKINTERELHEQYEIFENRLNEMSSSIPANYFQRLSLYLKKRSLRNKIRNKRRDIDSKISNTIQNSVKVLTEKNIRYQYIISNFSDAVNESSFASLKELERKRRIIEEVNTSISGALGEHKVAKELEQLSDDYFLINDFSVSFDKPIYHKIENHRYENEWIRSIQVDHLLISPAGIFIIETKNWNEQSLHDWNLRSPVDQVRRSSFALFTLLSKDVTNGKLKVDQHRWGDRKIQIKNLIVLVNSKPKEEFQYVKTLTLNQLLGYVQYFKPTFSATETKAIADYFLKQINITP